MHIVKMWGMETPISIILHFSTSIYLTDCLVYVYSNISCFVSILLFYYPLYGHFPSFMSFFASNKFLVYLLLNGRAEYSAPNRFLSDGRT